MYEQPSGQADQPSGDVPLSGTVLGVCAGRTGTLTSGRREVRSAFVKAPLPGPVHLGVLGLPGDEHVYEDHGGPDMAVLVYPHEHYAHWRGLGLEVPEVGAMAENLTVSGLVETDVCLGDVFTVGSAVVQVCQPRSPCYKLGARFGRADMPVLMQDTGYTGYLLRVLTEGPVAAGDRVTLVERTSDVTVAEAGRVANVDRHDLDGARRVLAVDALGASTRRKLAARLDAPVETGLETDRLFLPEA
jgi:MOSC domain-containing protein YiiM